jgi:hypothetical protein
MFLLKKVTDTFFKTTQFFVGVPKKIKTIFFPFE